MIWDLLVAGVCSLFPPFSLPFLHHVWWSRNRLRSIIYMENILILVLTTSFLIGASVLQVSPNKVCSQINLCGMHGRLGYPYILLQYLLLPPFLFTGHIFLLGIFLFSWHDSIMGKFCVVNCHIRPHFSSDLVKVMVDWLLLRGTLSLLPLLDYVNKNDGKYFLSTTNLQWVISSFSYPL